MADKPVKAKKDDERFIAVYEQNNMETGITKILVDRETGINYLLVIAAGAALTPLLDADGKPVVTPIEN